MPRSGARLRNAWVRVFVVAFAAALCARAEESTETEEPRLIGWLGEVARPPAPSATGDGATNSSIDDALLSSSSESAVKGASEIGAKARGTWTTLSWSPRAFLYQNFLTEDECEHLIALGEKKLERSTVVGSKGKEGDVHSARTSFGTFITRRLTPTLSAVEDRVAEYSGIPWRHQEQLQLLRYEKGQEYVAHHDGIVSKGNGEKRIATVLMFLREPEFGGETHFPDATPLPATRSEFLGSRAKLSDCGWNEGRGFSVIPRKGDAILFFSHHINGTSDDAANHASCPTLRGIKYTATKWIHEKEFDTTTFETPMCEDKEDMCDQWANSGECEKNPVFMMGIETVGSCSKSCCARDRSRLSDIQKRFCEPCDEKM